MADQQVIRWGPFDTPEQATIAFASRNVLPRAASYAINWNDLTDNDSATLLKKWYVLGVGHVLLQEAAARTSAAKLRKGGLLIAALNSLAFEIPEDEKFTAPEAARWVKTCTVGYICFMRLASMSLLDEQTYAGAQVVGGALHGIANLPPTLAEWAVNVIPAITNEGWMRIITWLVSLIRGFDEHINLMLYTSMYIGMAKRGTISDAKIDKIKGSIRDEVGVDPPITEDIISGVYRAFGKYINETNASEVFNRWAGMMEERSLSMRILLMQTAHAGLTAIETIRTALNTFPEIPWAEIVKVLPNEVPHVRAALQVTQTNPYYGFKKDISNIASTKYKTFAWFAKELLIRKGGPQYEGLKNYGGWTRNPLHRAKLDEIINNFNPDEDAVVTQEHQNVVIELKNFAALEVQNE